MCEASAKVTCLAVEMGNEVREVSDDAAAGRRIVGMQEEKR